MDLRRLLLILAVLLLVAAGAASLAPPPEEESETGATAPAATGATETEAADQRSEEVIEAELDAGGEAKDGKNRVEQVRVDTGARVILTVSVPAAGQVELMGLGQVDSAEPETPAVFDLLLDRPGRYEAVFTPTDGPARTAGAIVVGEDGEDGHGSPAAGRGTGASSSGARRVPPPA